MPVKSLLQISPLEVPTNQRIQHAVTAFEVLRQVLLDAGVHPSAPIVSLQKRGESVDAVSYGQEVCHTWWELLITRLTPCTQQGV